MRLFIGVHHNPPDGIGPLSIILGTQALFSNFVMGPKNPATHAFVVVMLEGRSWVLDGQPSGARWTPCYWSGGGVHPYRHLVSGGLRFHTPPRPEVQAIWEVTVKHREPAGVDTARTLDNAAYDWGEIAASAVTAFSVLPGLHKLKLFGRKDVFDEALICTHVCVKTLMGMGGPAAEAMRTMPNLFPEGLAQTMVRGEGVWCVRQPSM